MALEKYKPWGLFSEFYGIICQSLFSEDSLDKPRFSEWMKTKM